MKKNETRQKSKKSWNYIWINKKQRASFYFREISKSNCVLYNNVSLIIITDLGKVLEVAENIEFSSSGVIFFFLHAHGIWIIRTRILFLQNFINYTKRDLHSSSFITIISTFRREILKNYMSDSLFSLAGGRWNIQSSMNPWTKIL